MIIQFFNVNESEKEQICKLEDSYPEDIVVSDIVASFDSQTAIQLVISLGAAVIEGVAIVIAAVLTRKKEHNSALPPNIVLIYNDGRRVPIENEDDIEKIKTYE